MEKHKDPVGLAVLKTNEQTIQKKWSGNTSHVADK